MVGCSRRLLVRGALPGIVFLLAAGCRSKAPIDHSEDIAALVNWPAPGRIREAAFEPVSAMERSAIPVAAPSPYRVGIRDVLEVRVLNKEKPKGFEEVVTVPVKENGFVYLPGSRKVQVVDKPTVEIEEAIAKSLADDVTDPLVNVEVTTFRARSARVLGDGVEQEQILTVDGHLTLLEGLIKSGATRKTSADKEEAYLIRGGKVHPFSIAAIVSQGDPSGDLVLEQGDHVVVPGIKDRMDFVYVFGQVKAPGRFPMDQAGRTWERGRMTLMGAVGMAGGVIEGAVDCNKICVFRGGCNDLRVFRIGVQELFQCGESIALLPGDRVYVAPNGMAKFNMSLQPFLPFLGGVGTSVGLALSGAALFQSTK